MAKDPENPPGDNVMGVKKGRGPDQYGGSFAGGQSGGGAYANPHVKGEKTDDHSPGGQSHQGYYGGGQAGAENPGDGHYAASVRNSPSDDDGKYTDHPSQKGGPERSDFEKAVTRRNDDHADEAEAPGDIIQGSEGEPVTGKP